MLAGLLDAAIVWDAIHLTMQARSTRCPSFLDLKRRPPRYIAGLKKSAPVVVEYLREHFGTRKKPELLGLVRWAIGLLIRQFEDQLGYPLFERTGGRLRPTPEAETLYANTRTLFTHFESVRNLAEDLRDTQAGTLKFLASPSIGQTVVPNAISAFVATPDSSA